MKGRKPLPTALKIAKQMRADRVNYLDPKVPAETDLSPPEYFDGPEYKLAREHWETIVPKLAEAGLVTVVDRPALEALCLCYQWWRTDRTVARGYVEWRKIAEQFGMTPSSRSRIRVNGKQTDELDLFLGTG